MRVDVVFLLSELKKKHLEGRVVIVFDVLRATTTISAALAAGVREILVFPDVDAVRAAKVKTPAAFSCGEQQCVKPEGFDLGNSPDAFGPLHAGKTLLMSTTNGTKAILAARGAARILTGAVVNMQAVAKNVQKLGRDVTMLCAGTNGEVAMEDVIGAGAVASLLPEYEASDAALLARQLFESTKGQLPAIFRTAAGGRNILRAGLEKDIDFAARKNVFDVVGEVQAEEPIRIVGTSWNAS